MTKIAGISCYYYLRNKIVNWLDSDNESSWQQHMLDPERRHVLMKYGLASPESVTYKFNSQGFRSEEFSDQPGFIALGCSFTLGMGVPYLQTWPQIIADHLGLPAWNLGQGGGSMDTCWRLLNHWLAILPTEFVCLLRPTSDRFEFYLDQQKPCMFLPSQHDTHAIQKYWYDDLRNSETNFEKNHMALSYLCAMHGKKMYWLDLEQAMWNLPHREPWPLARDMLHVGFDSHEHCAKMFLRLIDQN